MKRKGKTSNFSLKHPNVRNQTPGGEEENIEKEWISFKVV